MRKEVNSEELYLSSNTTDAEVSGAVEAEVVPTEEKARKCEKVSEILELRGENKKVFRMSDGTEQAEFYPNAVHLLDEETGEYIEPDNTLELEADGKHYRNKKGRFAAKFNREENSDELFSVEKGMHKVSVSAKKSKKRLGKTVSVSAKPKKGFNGKSVAALLDPIFDGISFGGMDDVSALEYTVTDDGVKENIIIYEKASAYHYAFIIHCENVSAIFDELSKRVAFVSNETGEEVFFIPAPFMTDANGTASDNVSYEVKTLENGDVQLTITADSEWINSEERAFPVAIDPQVMVSGSTNLSTFSWCGGYMSNASTHKVGTTGNGDGTCNANRMYMSFAMPTLPRNPRIKKVELIFTQSTTNTECPTCPKFGLFRVTDVLATGNLTPVHEAELIDYENIKHNCEDGEACIKYTFDVTALMDKLNKEGASSANLVLMMLDETVLCNQSITVYGSSAGTNAPYLAISYESSYAVNASYRTHTHELGKFGQGSIDLACGNLMFNTEDFAWSGNRMPVTIRHLYNSALSDIQYTGNDAIKLQTADFSAMKLGKGWKLNLMQSIIAATFHYDGESYNGFVFVDENGSEVYFKESNTTTCCSSRSHCYNLYEDVSGSGMMYDPEKKIISLGDETYHFDTLGRLVKIADQYNSMAITYTANRITSVSDGVGREFRFAYTDGLLTSITAPDGTVVSYGYESDLLTSITYPDERIVKLVYDSGKPSAVTVCDASENVLHKVEYEFDGDSVKTVSEFGMNNEGGATSTYEYSVASNRTTVSVTEADETEITIKKVYAFDDDGNIVSEYMYSEETGNVAISGAESGINPISEGGIVSNINNLLVGHNFASLDAWTSMEGNSENLHISAYANSTYPKFGKYALRMASFDAACVANGVFQAVTLDEGEYVFSAYVRVTSAMCGDDVVPGAYIRVVDASGNILSESEHLAVWDSEFIRLVAPFAVAEAQEIKVQILLDGYGVMFADGVQLENNSVANDYNMIENSNFERGLEGWIPNDVAISDEVCFNMSKALVISGELDKYKYASQTVPVKTTRSTRETFTLSGWAKGNGLPTREREYAPDAIFRLRAVVKYYDTYYKTYSSEAFTADFAPCTDEWQFASIQFAKSQYRMMKDITVYCDYSCNTGVAYFDDIQLVRNSIETGLSASDFVIESDGYDDEDEIIESESSSAPVFEEAKDGHGNALTETTFADGEFGTIYRSFGFADDGNDLVKETDARGNTTEYTVDDETSRNEEIIDRLGNKTAHEYDASGRTTKVTSSKPQLDDNGIVVKDENGKIQYDAIANVSYSYDAFDNLKEIVRGDGMKYALAYDAFHNLESIGIEGKSEQLVKYDYKKGSGRLKSVTYANGNVMYATYNSIGQMIGEEWKDVADGNTIAKYKYSYDGSGNIVRSLDILSEIEYTYTYEQGRIVRATEARVSLNDNGFAVSKDIVNTIRFTYDGEGQLAKKTFVPANGETTVVHIDNADGNTIVKFSAGGHNITSHSKTDSFGRKVFDELQLGTGFVSRQFAYLAGKVTEEHKDNSKIKSSATTQLVSQIVLSDGMTLSYSYDAEERITSVVESYVVGEETVTNTILYTYDALGQLLTETVNSVVVNEMTYDNYGNILTKNGKAYTYGDSIWKDKLTSIDGQDITYDAQGNPVSYLGHTLTWEKGRQLKSFDGISYTYNANGIRTSKTVGGIKHDFTLDGTKILREVWGDNTLVPMYDNEDSVCGIIYNSVPYYFLKNLQGDIISIVDKDACVIARYSYDAWGKVLSVADNNGQLITDATHIAHLNPFRYRGYFFDTEIGLYYLQSRYYNPSTGRFVNSDIPEIIVLHGRYSLNVNMYAYCNNDIVSKTDATGSCSTNTYPTYKPSSNKTNNNSSSGYIDDQNNDRWKNVAVGFWGNVKDNGCGAIAIYNILYSYSKKTTINDVLSNLRWMYGNILYNNLGVIGISPASVTNYLKSKFWFVYTAGPITYLWGIKAELSGGIIVLYQHKGWNSSLHYVAGIKTGSGTGGSFRFYNDSYYKKKYGTKSISVWKYIDLLKENGCKPLLFWGVAEKFGWW